MKRFKVTVNLAMTFFVTLQITSWKLESRGYEWYNKTKKRGRDCMSIPKIIHYCWFGQQMIPAEIAQYMDSWKKVLPDYEIIEWNESRFDVTSVPYVKAAYEAGKYAFVSDYVRLYALAQYGGIYFDVDIQVLHSFDAFLEHQAFFGFESDEKVMTAMMAAVSHHPLIEAFLNSYQTKIFDPDHLEPNTVMLTGLLQKEGLLLNGKTQPLSKGIMVYALDYFNGFDFAQAELCLTDHTCSIHHCYGSWCSPKDQFIFKMKKGLRRILGRKGYALLKKWKKKWL